MNHGQFTGRFFTLMNDNTGHEKYSLLLSKKKWAGLSKRTRAPQITVFVCMQPNRYLARQNISIPIVGTLKPVSSAQFLLVREVCKGNFVQVWNKKNENPH